MINTVSTKKLAALIGKSESFASQIKSGHRRLPPKYYERVSKAFNIPIEQLCPKD
jgi:DNA-binding transcriptional regulator YdaS (Cro superfamily)